MIEGLLLLTLALLAIDLVIRHERRYAPPPTLVEARVRHQLYPRRER